MIKATQKGIAVEFLRPYDRTPTGLSPDQLIQHRSDRVVVLLSNVAFQLTRDGTFDPLRENADMLEKLCQKIATPTARFIETPDRVPAEYGMFGDYADDLWVVLHRALRNVRGTALQEHGWMLKVLVEDVRIPETDNPLIGSFADYRNAMYVMLLWMIEQNILDTVCTQLKAHVLAVSPTISKSSNMHLLDKMTLHVFIFNSVYTVFNNHIERDDTPWQWQEPLLAAALVEQLSNRETYESYIHVARGMAEVEHRAANGLL